MNKSPDETKKGLAYCVEPYCPGEKCPYWNAESCAQDKTYDALALIQQLEADNAQLNRCIENMTDKLNAMNDEVAKLQAERDAAMRMLMKQGCAFCMYLDKESWEEPCLYCYDSGRWEWRGVQKEE